MTIDEALRTMQATLDPWAAKNGMQKVWARPTFNDRNATTEYAGGEVLVQFYWDRHDPIVFTTLYRTDEPGPDEEKERQTWLFNLPQVNLPELRHGWAKLRVLLDWRVNTREKLITRLNSQIAELDTVLSRLQKGDWSGVRLRRWPDTLQKMTVRRPEGNGTR
jgi:hypothetical protein